MSRPIATIFASAALTTVLGSIHAFSVFVPEWESRVGVNRADVSLTYSLALVTLTIAVLVGYRLYARLSPPLIILLAGVGASAGLLLASTSESTGSLYVFYGVLFGGANGLGYGFALQLAGQALPARRGLAMGLVTAFYAVGATGFPFLLVTLINLGGNRLALIVLAAIVFGVSLLSCLIVHLCQAEFATSTDSQASIETADSVRTRFLLWLGYGTGAAAGLMIIGHAFGIALWIRPGTDAATLAPVLVAFGNMLGGFTASYITDRMSSRVLLRWLPVGTVIGLSLLLWRHEMAYTFALFGLGVIGFCYGALIAVYPVAVADVFGTMAAPKMYGQIFTAWGLAGLIGPWSSGFLFDRSGSYVSSIVLAMVLSSIAVCITFIAVSKTTNDTSPV